MAEVTVCVPAWRAGDFIAATLSSVQRQTFTDLAVEIAIEPADQGETWRACEPFLRDPRFRVTMNSENLGWDRNVNSLLEQVSTPFFMILPHDDILHPRYIETLHSALRECPEASVAYGDMYFFGNQSGGKGLALPSQTLPGQLMDFFLAGAEAVPWRGVTRRQTLDGQGFPQNAFSGFAVECEWVLHLLRRGRALRVARPLYFKRTFESASVSKGWIGLPEDTLKEALEHHRQKMIEGVKAAELSPAGETPIMVALEAAMLRRYVSFSNGRFPLSPLHLERSCVTLHQAAALDAPIGSQITSRVELALSTNGWNLGDLETGLRSAHAAAAADPDYWEARAWLGRLLLCHGQPHDALEQFLSVAALAPQTVGLQSLLNSCDAAINSLYSLPLRESMGAE